MTTLRTLLKRPKRSKTITKDQAMARSAEYYLQERNRYRLALIEIAGAQDLTAEKAETIAAKALRLHPHGQARWATWDETAK